MTIPYEAIGSGAIVSLVWLGRTLMLKRKNGKGNGVKPGTSAICTENIRLISGHEVLLTQLCLNSKRCDDAIIKLHDENRKDYREINRKLDNLFTGGR